MPQQIQVPNRDVVLEYPDDATDDQIKSDINRLYPRNGEDVFKDTQAYNALEYRPSFDDFLKLEAYQKDLDKNDTRSTFEKGIDVAKELVSGALDVGKTFLKAGESAARLTSEGDLPTAAISLIEGGAQGMASMAMPFYGENTQSPLFKFKSFVTGTGTPQERYEQFLEARKVQTAMKLAASGDIRAVPAIKELGGYDPDLAAGAALGLDALNVYATGSKLLKGLRVAEVTGAGMLKQAARDIAAERAVIGEAAKTIGAAETVARRTSYLSDWVRGAEAAKAAVLEAAQKEAAKFIEIDPAKAASILDDATAYGDKIVGLAQKGVEWRGSIERGAVGWAAAQALGIGSFTPLIAGATVKLGEGFAKSAEFFANVAKEAAETAAQYGGGQVSTMERMASQGSTFGRRMAAEAAAKYGIPLSETIKGATQGAVGGAIVGAGLGYLQEGTAEGAARGAGGGMVMGTVAGAGHGAYKELSGEAYNRRVVRDFAEDYQSRPDSVTVDFIKQEPVFDADGNVVGFSEGYVPTKINDKEARAKAVERFSGKELGRILNITKIAEEAGAKVVFHDDNFSVPEVGTTKYNGVHVLTGSDGTSTILLNVDRMKASTASHEVFHALVGDEFKKQMREAILGDITQFDAQKFADSEVGNQFKSFVETYADRLKQPEFAKEVLRGLEDPNLSPVDRAGMVARGIEEFGAYYFENWLQNKHPDILNKQKIPNFWREAFRNVQDNIYREFGLEQARAQGASVDPITGHFYKDGRRIVIPEWDSLASRFLQENKIARKGMSFPDVPLTNVPRPRAPMAVVQVAPKEGQTIEAEVVPVTQRGLPEPVVSQRVAAAQKIVEEGNVLPPGPTIYTAGTPLQIAEKAVERLPVDERSKIVRKVLAEMDRVKTQGGGNNPTIFVDAGSAGIVEVPNPYYKPGAKPKPPKQTKAKQTATGEKETRPKEKTLSELLAEVKQERPSATKTPLPPSITEAAKAVKAETAAPAPEPAPVPTKAPTPVQSPFAEADSLKKYEPPTVEAEIVKEVPVKGVEEASQVTQTPTVLQGIPDARKLEVVKQLGLNDSYLQSRSQSTKINKAQDPKYRQIFGTRVITQQDSADKLIPNAEVGKELVYSTELTPEQASQLAQQFPAEYGGKEQMLTDLGQFIENKTPFRLSAYHAIDVNGRTADFYKIKDRLVMAFALAKTETSGMNVRVFDLDQMRDNLNALNNDPVKIQQLKTDKLPIPKNVRMTYGRVLEALGLYFDNLNQSVPVPSDKLFADKYFDGDLVKGKYFRDLLYIIRDIPQDKVPMSEMYNMPPIKAVFTARTGEKAKRKQVPGREEKRRPGGTNTIANVRLDRITGVKPAPKGENFPIDYRQHAFNKAQGNFQPADTVVENLGNGTVITDKRTGWRMVSKDGKKQRVYRPDGSLLGIFNSVDEAKAALNKLEVKAMEFESSSAKTQIATTVNTYNKASSQLTPNGRTIDYGAGLGLGADVLRNNGFVTDSYEPFPGRWKGQKEVTFTDSSEIPSSAYDNVTNFSVLNVVKPDVRDFIVSEIGRILAPKGKALITARTLQDVSAAKIKTPSTEPGGFIVGDRYQKGFSQKELREYVKNVLGDGFTVQDNPKLNGASIKITKH